LRAKVLAKWNERIEPVQFLWAGKKDECILQITLSDNEPLGALFGRLVSLAKLAVACINIGSIGYFWFQRPGFEQKMFKEVRDLEIRKQLDFGSPESFWGNGRAVSLTDEHVDHAVHCMMAFAPLSETDAEPIFAPYFNGLAMIAKSDTFYRFDELARHAFVGSLAGALRYYGGWSGKSEDFEECLHRCFAPFMPEQQHRDKVFLALRTRADPTETALANLRTAKQLADLYLVHTARRTWTKILDHRERKRTQGGNEFGSRQLIINRGRHPAGARQGSCFEWPGFRPRQPGYGRRKARAASVLWTLRSQAATTVATTWGGSDGQINAEYWKAMDASRRQAVKGIGEGKHPNPGRWAQTGSN
jgi:hypothetical protein